MTFFARTLQNKMKGNLSNFPKLHDNEALEERSRRGQPRYRNRVGIFIPQSPHASEIGEENRILGSGATVGVSKKTGSVTINIDQ